ncbi:MAG: lysylphosphatidylglycerol synthase domain-containing protein [Lentimonas sp.]
MKVFFKWLGSGVACLALFYFFTEFKGQMGKALPLVMDLKNLPWLLLCAIGVVPHMAFAGIAWQRILLIVGVTMRPLIAMRILFISQLARYIPGNVGHHVGRLVLAKQEGVPLKVGTVTILIETFIILSLSALISLIAFPEYFYQFYKENSLGGILIGAVVCLVIIVCVLIWKWPVLMQKIDIKYVRSILAEMKVTRFIEISICYMVNFLFTGAVAWILATQIFGDTSLGFLYLMSIMTFSWIVGFLTPGAPAGLGVREVIALWLLSRAYAPDVAVSLVVLHRVVLTVGDLFTFLIGLGLSGIKEKPVLV